MSLPIIHTDEIIDGEDNQASIRNVKLVTSPIIIQSSEIKGSINFANSLFRQEVSIRDTYLNGTLTLKGAVFGGTAAFDNTEFFGDVDFRYATFRKGISLEKSRFYGKALFSDSKFNLSAVFYQAAFNRETEFNNTQFVSGSNFEHTVFNKAASFGYAGFNDLARFQQSSFLGIVDFDNAIFQEDAEFVAARFEKVASFKEAVFMKKSRFFLSKFLSACSFSKVRFQESTDFSETSFKDNANFAGAKFSKDAIFRGSLFTKSFVYDKTVFLGQIDIEDADFGNINDRKYIENFAAKIKSSIDPPKDTGVENAIESKSSDAESEVQATSITSDDKNERNTDPIDIAADILADRSEADLLGFSDYADALTDFIRNKKPEEPLIIGIDASWGMGKTKLMEMIRNNLAESSYKTVWFNAWKYDKEQSLWAALVLEILAQVRNKSNRFQRFRLWIKLNFYIFSKNLKWNLVKLSASIGFTIIFGYIIFVDLSLISNYISSSEDNLSQQLHSIISILEGFKTLNVLAFIIALYILGKSVYSHLVGPFDLKIDRYVQTSNYKDRVGFLSQFEEDFEYVVNLVTETGKRPLVVFIDDLDRCTPPKPADIIEAINVLLDANHCAFIIGMDSQAVAASIEAKYKDLRECYDSSFDSTGLTLGQRFLEKIIQINFHIPTADDDLMASFVDANLGVSLNEPKQVLEEKPLEKHVEEISAWIEDEEKEGKSLDEAVKAIKKTTPETSQAAINEARMRRVAKILFENSGDVRQAINRAVPYLGSNPRKIKRFINLFRLMALIANRRGLLERKIIRLDSLAKWVVVTMRWPLMIETMESNHDFVSHIMRENIIDSRILNRMYEKSPKDTNDFIYLMKSIREEELDYYLHLAETTVERHDR